MLGMYYLNNTVLFLIRVQWPISAFWNKRYCGLFPGLGQLGDSLGQKWYVLCYHEVICNDLKWWRVSNYLKFPWILGIIVWPLGYCIAKLWNTGAVGMLALWWFNYRYCPQLVCMRFFTSLVEICFKAFLTPPPPPPKKLVLSKRNY